MTALPPPGNTDPSPCPSCGAALASPDSECPACNARVRGVARPGGSTAGSSANSPVPAHTPPAPSAPFGLVGRDATETLCDEAPPDLATPRTRLAPAALLPARSPLPQPSPGPGPGPADETLDGTLTQLRPGGETARPPSNPSDATAPRRPAWPPPASPRHIGDYVIQRELGRGGMGVVYEAIQHSLGRRVALKVLNPAAVDPESIARFQREAAAAGRLTHPNIVGVYGAGREGDVHYFSMEFVEGESLSAMLKRGRVEPERVARLLVQAADALDYAHAQGVIHRDVKPANLLVTAADRLLVADFGLARDLTASTLTGSGGVFGTPMYMSPEQARGARAEIDRRTDVYSLGATLYEALACRPVFDGEDVGAVLYNVVHADPLPIAKRDRRCPPDLDTIAMKALEKDRDRRYATAGELREDLARFLRGEPVRARPAGTIFRIFRKARRNLPALRVAVGALLLMTAGGGWGYQRWLGERTRAREQEAQAGLERRGAALEKAAKLVGRGDAASLVEALQVLETAAVEWPDHVPIRLLQAQAHRAQGDWRAAETDTTRAVAATPGDPDPLLARARIRREAGLLREALGDLDALLRVAPDRYVASILRGQARLEAGDAAGAEVDARAAAKAAVGNAETLEVECLRLAVHRASGEPRLVLAEARALVERTTAAAEASRADEASRMALRRCTALARLEEARVLRSLGEDLAALKALEEAVSKAPTLVPARLELALCCFHLFDPAGSRFPVHDVKADAAVVEAHRLAPSDVRCWWTRALIAARPAPSLVGDPMPDLDAVLARFPHWGPALVRRGQARLGAPEPDAKALAAAEADFGRALELAPGSAPALVGLGRIARAHGRPEEAIGRFEQALAAAPTLLSAAHGLASALTAAGRTTEAAAAWDRAASLSAEPPSAGGEETEHLLRARRRFAEWYGAADDELPRSFLDGPLAWGCWAHAQMALAIDPWCGEARLVRARTLAFLGLLKDALEEYGRAVEQCGPATAAVARFERLRIVRDLPGVRELPLAARDLSALLALRPRDPVLLDESGLLRDAEGDAVGALADFDLALALAPPGWVAPRYHRAAVLERLGRKEEAERERAAWRRDGPAAPPPGARFWLRLAPHLGKKYPRVELLLTDRALAECPRYALAWYMRGDPSIAAGIFEHVALDLTRSARYNPLFASKIFGKIRENQVKARSNWAFGVLMGNLPKTIEHEDGSDPVVRFGKAFFAGLWNRFDVALEESDAALAADPENLAASAWRGWALHKLGREAEAERALAEVDARCPDLTIVHFFRAAMLASAGKLDLAAQHLYQALGRGLSVEAVRQEPELSPLLDREELRAWLRSQ
ncbi:MAG: protein kinase [Planctomycetes bacterium]|nr:protein kinase [Planctomycetota bacterium]